MLNFKLFLENEWLIDDPDDPGLLDQIHSDNSEIQPENQWKLPSASSIYGTIDPDDFYNRNGVFTFSYSERKVNGETEGLRVTHSKTAHRQYLPLSQDRSPIITGRYGLYSGITPIVTIWSNSHPYLIKSCLKELWNKNLIHKQSYLFIGGDNLGKVHDFIFSKVPAKFKQEAGQEVELPSGKYLLRELPALLHTLPSSSDKHKEICQFICKNHDKYPILKNFLSKAGCNQITQQPKTTLQQRMLQFTSEETVLR